MTKGIQAGQLHSQGNCNLQLPCLVVSETPKSQHLCENLEVACKKQSHKAPLLVYVFLLTYITMANPPRHTMATFDTSLYVSRLSTRKPCCGSLCQSRTSDCANSGSAVRAAC
jgi:hypothetical protein